MIFSYSGFLVENKKVNGHSYRLVKCLELNMVYLVLYGVSCVEYGVSCVEYGVSCVEYGVSCVVSLDFFTHPLVEARQEVGSLTTALFDISAFPFKMFH